MLEQMDGCVGRLLGRLEELGLAEDTVVVFMSDNGPQYFGDRLPAEQLAIRYGSGYKGHKGNMWENGIKSPLWVRWRGTLAPREVGRLADVCDVMPTLLDLCGIEAPAGLDGRSVRAYLEGDEGSLGPKESFIYVNPAWPPHDHAAGEHCEIHAVEWDPVAPEARGGLEFLRQWVGVRTEGWKLLQNPGWVPGAPYPVEGRVLVDMGSDPKEDRNVLAAYPAEARALSARLSAWWEGVKREGHAFEAPVFALGPGTTGLVPVYAPVRMRGGVHNGGTRSERWRAGEGAAYRVRVEEGGRYSVRLGYRAAEGEGARVRVRCGEAVLEAALPAAPGEGEAVLGEMVLAAGEGELALEVTGGGAVAGMVGLHFDPVREGASG
jgi:uncharacterized sulfatase